MTTAKPETYGRKVIISLVWSAVAVCATAALAADADKPSGAASALEEVVTRPGLPARASAGYFDDNPACVSAKLDVWFQRGRHMHQLFMPGAEQVSAPPSRPSDRSGKGGQTDAPIQESMSAGGTTIIVGGEGCRIRVRIDRAE